MWPKMLLELLPRFARLVPAADRFLATRTASERAQEAALAALALEMRTELGRGTDSQAGLARRIEEQSDRIGELALEARGARSSIEAVGLRLAKLEQTMERVDVRSVRAVRVMVAVGVLVAASLALLVMLAIHALAGAGR